LGLFFFFWFAWWVCVNAHSTSKPKEEKQTQRLSFRDDSAQQLRDKEQQRLSSK